MRTNGSALIRATELAQLVTDGHQPVILDVRWSLAGADRAAFEAGHIPGAVHCVVEQDLSDHARSAEEAGRHPLPTAEKFTSSMQALGVSSDSLVVVYDERDSISAARAWWCLTYFGHANVRVLEGGFSSWVNEGHAVTTQVNDVATSGEAFIAVPGNLPTVTIDEVASGDGIILVDVRAAERFRGDIEPVDPVPGHIPGAINSPTLDLVAPDGRFLGEDALLARFDDGRFLGIDALLARFDAAGVLGESDLPVVAYCGSGVTAAHTVLALHLVGKSAALFPGSYSQWCRDLDRPVARGGL
ncbi:MAG: sulfurtransferase [Actinobacteria bacterium]|nr:sulfurtransferase [Actinomycetota bacterium]